MSPSTSQSCGTQEDLSQMLALLQHVAAEARRNCSSCADLLASTAEELANTLKIEPQRA